MTQHRKFLTPRTALPLLCAILTLILSAMLGQVLGVCQELEQMRRFDAGSSLYLSQEALDAIAASGPISYTLSEPESSPPAAASGSVLNVLLIGQDRREGEGRARSDTMILCTFQKETKTLTMTSFLRDLYVTIPGWGGNRINAAYAFGGMELLKKTVEQNFGIPIHGCLEVDFSQFSKIVDQLGGVTLELRQDEAAHISLETGSSLAEGMQLLNGSQALSYARIRKLDADGDFGRTQRQRRLLSALLEAYRNASLLTLLPTVSKLLPMITTDLSSTQLLGYAMELLPTLSGLQLQSQHIPAQGTYSDRIIDGMAVLWADMDAARELLMATQSIIRK